MKKILMLMMVASLLLSLFTNCSEKDDDPVIITSLTVDKTSFSVEATASDEQFSVLSNKDWTAKTEVTWLSISPSSGKADSKLSVNISISANTGTEARSATITITAADKNAEVKVEQKGKVVVPGIAVADAKFKQYLVEAFDANKDGEISTGEAEAVKAMSLSGKGVESLSGIEFFVNLETLNCNNNSLATLDLSKNIQLTTFSCDSNKIDSLGLSANTLLKVLSCSTNGMTKLDISKNTALTDLNCSSNELTSLEIRSNSLSEPGSESPETTSARLDISNNTLLKTLDCSKNKLSVLDISKNSELTSLICSDNSLTVLDVSKNSKLTKLDCRNNKSLEKILLAKDQVITDLQYDDSTTDLEYPAPEKKIVNIPDAKFKAYLVGLFDTDKNGEISEDEALVVKEIKCYNKGISSLVGISAFVNLEILECYTNNISAIDISGNLKLREFDCSTNPLAEINVSKNVALTRLYCYLCKLSFLDVGSNINLVELNCANNKSIRVLNLFNNTVLQKLFCQGNNLASLDLKKNLKLIVLNCRDNSELESVFLEQDYVIDALYIDTPPTKIVYPNYLKFKDQVFHNYLVDNFDIDKDGNLSEKEVGNIKEIDCSKLGITTLEGIDQITNLTSLICSGNEIASIDISKNTALHTFKCDSNNLTSINVSSNILLEVLSFGNNRIRTINVGSNTNLKQLICNANLISNIDIKNNKKLETLLCQDNYLNTFLYLNYSPSLKMVNCTNNITLKVIYLKTGQIIETILYDEEKVRIVYEDEIIDDTQKFVNIPDPKFKGYLLNLYDSDKDGQISEAEAKAVTIISCSALGISSLEGIESFINLYSLNCNSNALTSLSLIENTKLTEINCYSNKIESLDVTGCENLTSLICGLNPISTLNLSKNKKLTYLDCTHNNLSVLNVRNSPSISTILCTGNPGTLKIYLMGSQNPSITGNYTTEDPGLGVSFGDPLFENFLLTHTTYDRDNDGVISPAEALNVTIIECRSYGIKSLKGIEEFTNLKELDCFDNNISGPLDLSENKQLTNLVCSSNSITSIDVSLCPSLIFLVCDDNKLTSLDLTPNKMLQFLDCQMNSGLRNLMLPNEVKDKITLYKDSNTTVTYQ